MANSDLESEIVKLRKKCGQLESMVQGNDSTPRRKELCKRLIHESPAPELPTTPIVEEVHFQILINYLVKKDKLCLIIRLI